MIDGITIQLDEIKFLLELQNSYLLAEEIRPIMSRS